MEPSLWVIKWNQITFWLSALVSCVMGVLTEYNLSCWTVGLVHIWRYQVRSCLEWVCRYPSSRVRFPRGRWQLELSIQNVSSKLNFETGSRKMALEYVWLDYTTETLDSASLILRFRAGPRAVAAVNYKTINVGLDLNLNKLNGDCGFYCRCKNWTS